MRRLRHGLKRLRRMSDPYRVDDGMVCASPGTLRTPQLIQKICIKRLTKFDARKKLSDAFYLNDPSYDWAAQTRRARAAKQSSKPT